LDFSLTFKERGSPVAGKGKLRATNARLLASTQRRRGKRGEVLDKKCKRGRGAKRV